jgi:glutathione S-transferase
MIKLYYTAVSCGAASFIAAHVAGVTIETEKVDTGTHLTASGVDYYSINPKGNVPCLVLDDGTMLNEGAAVLQYITDQVRIIPLRFLSRILNISLYLIPSFRANRLLALSPRSMARARDISPRT